MEWKEGGWKWNHILKHLDSEWPLKCFCTVRCLSIVTFVHKWRPAPVFHMRVCVYLLCRPGCSHHGDGYCG